MKNFDLFVGIDWSGAKTPIQSKSIALASVEFGQSAPVLFPEIRSRYAVADWIEGLVGQTKRAFIGIDCNFGYAASVIDQQLEMGASAFDLWDAVEKKSSCDPNFFAGGFLEDRNFGSYFWQSGKRLNDFEMPKRQTEITCAENGYGHPESPFKLIGAKQVGKGGLSGMRLAHHLKKKLGNQIAIWPFEKNYDDAQIVMSEIYPRQFLMRAGYGTKKVRDLESLNALLPYFGSNKIKGDAPVSDHDTDALVSAAGLRYLCGADKGTIPAQISAPIAMTQEARRCEGWIFGVGDKVI